MQGLLLQIDISEIIVHEGDEPNAFVDFLDAEPLSCEHGRDVDLLAMHADAATGGDEDITVMEGIGELRQALIGAW